jgi:hypothetical protein
MPLRDDREILLSDVKSPRLDCGDHTALQIAPTLEFAVKSGEVAAGTKGPLKGAGEC